MILVILLLFIYRKAIKQTGLFSFGKATSQVERKSFNSKSKDCYSGNLWQTITHLYLIHPKNMTGPTQDIISMNKMTWVNYLPVHTIRTIVHW